MTAQDCYPRHEVKDQEKVASIALSMEANGYIGAPVVLLGSIQVTGVHRRAAWLMLERGLTELPCVDLFDLCPELEQEWEEICEDAMDVGEREVQTILSMVPADIAEQYGIEE